jgi:hypothetical protein
MALDGLRARLDQLLAELSRGTDARDSATGLYQAMVEVKTAISVQRDALRVTERELMAERERLTDAERRGALAAQIGDAETAELAGIWTGKHRQRVEILERKKVVQQDELAYAERQLEEIGEAYRQARLGVPPAGGTGSPVQPPEPDAETDRMGRELDRQAQQALVQEQLRHLKKKLGRQD